MKLQTLLTLAAIGLTTAYRLPQDVMPESYKLEIISPFGEKDNFDFEGKVWIEVSKTQNIFSIKSWSKYSNS